MTGFLKNKKLLSIVLGSIFVVITLTIGVFAALGAKSVPTGTDLSSSQSSQSSSDTHSDSQGSSSDSSNENTLPEAVNKPDEMRAVTLVPGVDFLTSAATDEETLKAEIDQAIANAKDLSMNTIVVDTKYDDLVIWRSEMLPAVEADTYFSIMKYIVDKARENGMYVYAIYNAADVENGDAVKKAAEIDETVLDEIGELAAEFASLYQPDGILLDGYTYEKTPASYSAYLKDGNGVGFENYLRSVPEAVVRKAVCSIQEVAPHIEVGLLTDAVWANKSSNDQGSDTSADYEMLFDGNADVKGYIEQDLVDFVAVRAYGALEDASEPFETVVNWWADLARENGIDFYAVHAADKAGTQLTGWSSANQLADQVAAGEAAGFDGSIFNSLESLLQNPGQSTDALLEHYGHEVDEEVILKELTVVKPVEQVMTTKEPSIIISGASDPEEPVTINDQPIETDKAGYFSVSMDLQPGQNVFVIKHKDKTLTYTITRVVQIIEKVSPEGSLSVEGGMKVEMSVYAYEGSNVYAVINGQTVPLTLTEVEDDNTDKDSFYKKYVGEFQTPAATSSVQNLGNIVFYAEWQGNQAQQTGANVQVNRKAVVSSGKLIQVTAESAETFPTDVLNDNSVPDCFPLPKGTLDYAMGDELVWSDGNDVFKYYILASGNRVYSKDIAAYDSDVELEGNHINGITVQSDSRYTKVILNTEKKVPYTAHYSGSTFELTFSYTGAVPSSMSLNRNPLFTAANWSGHTLKLQLKTNGGFLGYKAYYDSNGNLVLRFNNPAIMQLSGSNVSLNGTRIVIDPGHSTKDPGALGFLPDKPEYYINYQLSLKLKALLESMGASVKLVNTTTAHPYLWERMAEVKSFEPHVLLSLHSNSAVSSARGSECYYFNDFSKSLASGVSSQVSSALSTNNRGAKFGYFYMTRDSEFPSVLSECGFVSNEEEYRKLIDDGYQQKMAQGIVNALVSYFKNTGSLVGTITGTQSNGDVQGVNVESVSLDHDELQLEIGEKATLTATVKPDDATNQKVVWVSKDPSIVSVSASGDNQAVLEGKKAGTAVVYAKSEDGAYTAECVVTVSTQPEEVALNKTELTLSVGDTEQLTGSVKPSGADQTLRWESSNKQVATVDENGKVTAVASGTVEISAIASNGKKTVCVVKVSSSSGGTSSGTSSYGE